MPREIGFSSYICDCGYRADFAERTVREMQELSRKKRGRHTLGCDDTKHAVIFEGGRMVDMVCRKRPDKG